MQRPARNYAFVKCTRLLHTCIIFTFAFCLLPFAFLLPCGAQPNNWNIRNYNTSDGLLSNDVNCVIKDTRGFIWVGTSFGLNRFDGYEFTRLEYASGETHQLSDVEVFNILEDHDSILWVGTSRGLFRFDPKEPVSRIRQYRYLDDPENNPGEFWQPVNFLCEDTTGLLWMSCVDGSDFINFGLRTFDRNSETFNYIQIDSSFSGNPGQQSNGFVTKILCDSRGTIWLGTDYGLYRYDRESGRFLRFVLFPDNNYSGENWILSVYENSQGNLWLGTNNGHMLFDRESQAFGTLRILDTIDSGVTFNMEEDAEGNLWVRENWSIFRIIPHSGLNGNQEMIEDFRYIFTDNDINPMFAFLVENPGSVWFAASGYGLYHININKKRFMTIKPANTHRRGEDFRDLYINSMLEDEARNLWVVSRVPGINIFDPSRKEQHHIDVPSLFVFYNTINRDQYGNLWLASNQGYVTRIIEKEDGRFTYRIHTPDPSDPTSLSIWSGYKSVDITFLGGSMEEHLTYTDPYGRLWFNTGTGIHDRYDRDLDGFVHLDHRHIDFFNNDSCLQKEIEGAIWLPTIEGLLRLIPPFDESGANMITPSKVIAYRHDPEDPASIGTGTPFTIFYSRVTEPGTIWIGMLGGGLSRLIFTPVTGTDQYSVSFRNYTEKDGLCDNHVLGILEDDQGSLWMSTVKGLSRFSPATEEFHNYYKSDGLPTNSFSYGQPLKGRDGKLYFPTQSGILCFHPDSIISNRLIPPVVITNMRIFNNTLLPGENSPLKTGISYARSIDLNYDQNHLSFEFAALNYEYPEKNQYKYMLEGLDNDWIFAGTRRYVEYTELKPGRYNFRVVGSNNDGFWNEEGASLEIFIHHPPWLNWYAYLVYIILAAGIALWIYRYLVNRSRMRMAVEIERIEKEKVLEMDTMRSRFFANVSHEFRTPLTLILGLVEELKKNLPGSSPGNNRILRTMKRNAGRLQMLVSQLLDISKLETGKVKLEVSEGNLTEFIRTIVLSFLSLAESKKITYDYELPKYTGSLFFDRDKLEKILTNLISNAFKFTPEGGRVSAVLNYRPDKGGYESGYAEISVSDTGKGIPVELREKIFDRFYQVSSSDTREQEGTGIGLALVRELMELYHGEIIVDSGTGGGSIFTIWIPVNRELFREEEIVEKPSVPERVEKEEWDNLQETSEEGIGDSKALKKSGDRNIILVVEDNADLRAYIKRNLENDNQILEAENGKSGFKKASAAIPDLVITDLMMPEMDGMELCRMLKEDERTSHIPVIMLTARADRDSKLKGLTTGADDYLIKPFDTEELQVRTRNLIEQRHKLREKFLEELRIRSLDENIGQQGDKFLHSVLELLKEQISNPDFNVNNLSQNLYLSRSQVFRKVRALTGSSPGDLLRIIRLKKAAEIIAAGNLNVTQVMYEVGFQSPAYFARKFREYYGMNPSEFRAQSR